ncbi:MAG: PilZ domain-containing protein [Roseiarcus sp.]
MSAASLEGLRAETQVGGYDDDPFLEDRDRRRGKRRATRLRAWADPGGTAPVVDCMIVDVSEEGAAVAPLDGAALPDAFHLQVDRTHPVGEAKVVWRKGNAVGVRLAKPKKP